MILKRDRYSLRLPIIFRRLYLNQFNREREYAIYAKKLTDIFFPARILFFFLSFFRNDSKITRLGSELNIFNERIL